MTPEQLQKLLKLTAIELPEDQKPTFLDYFNSMKVMFDDFASFPLPEWDIDVEDDEPISLFIDQKDFDWLDLVETNVIPERQVNHAIQNPSNWAFCAEVLHRSLHKMVLNPAWHIIRRNSILTLHMAELLTEGL